MTDSSDIPPIIRRFIENAGNATQSLGVGRVLGQIYAYLYFSPDPRNLADMQEVLGISKGSASTGVRQLEQWNAVRKVWVKGDRKDYYEANDWLGRILKNALLDTVGQKLTSCASLLDQIKADESYVRKNNGDSNIEFVKQRIDNLCVFQEKAQQALNSPLFRMLLK